MICEVAKNCLLVPSTQGPTKAKYARVLIGSRNSHITAYSNLSFQTGTRKLIGGTALHFTECACRWPEMLREIMSVLLPRSFHSKPHPSHVLDLCDR